MTENKKLEIKYPENELLIEYPKDKYEWNLISTNHKVYQIENKNNNKDFIFVKEFFLNNLNVNKYKQIYKELYLMMNLKSYVYFCKNVSFKFSKNKDYAFLITNEDNISLNNLFSKKYPYLENKRLIKWIIYQITFGLYILHSNNIIHNDIKPPNILINDKAGISINDFGSAIFKSEKLYSLHFTLSYAAPELLFNYSDKIDEKVDMWGLGVIMLELYLKKNKIFWKKEITKPSEQLEYILPKFGIKTNNPIEYIKNELNFNANVKFKIENEILEKIDDKNAVDLITNLLSFYPEERKSAREILESEYLKEFKGINSFKIESIEFPKDYEIISNNINDENFLKLLEKIKQ